MFHFQFWISYIHPRLKRQYIFLGYIYLTNFTLSFPLINLPDLVSHSTHANIIIVIPFQPSTASSRSAVSSTALSDLIMAMGDNLTHFNMSSNKMAGLPFVFKALSVSLSHSFILTLKYSCLFITWWKLSSFKQINFLILLWGTCIALNDIYHLNCFVISTVCFCSNLFFFSIASQRNISNILFK